MPPSRSDARALVFAMGSLVLAGIVVALVLLWATRTDVPGAGLGGGGTDVAGSRTFPLGPAETRYNNLVEEGPVYVANPFGDDGIWLALEDDEIVALALRVPGRPDCSVSWRGRDDTFKDCDDEPIATTELERHEVFVETEGEAQGQLVINLDVVEPAPADS